MTLIKIKRHTYYFSAQKKSYPDNLAFKIACVLFATVWCLFFATAKDHTDRWPENVLVILFFACIYLFRGEIVLSDVSFAFIFLFLDLHIYGARMAYTQNEFGGFLQNGFHLIRNPYDRIVHFSFGFLMLYPFADLLSGCFREKKNLVLISANMFIFCLATAFELIEWGVAGFTDKITGETYVAAQGDPWDAQKDIFLALLGSVLFTVIYKIAHNRHANNKLKRVRLLFY